MYGADLVPDFWELGYELFRDRETFKAKFLLADVFDESSPLQALEEKLDVIYLGSVLHLFDWNGQISALKNLVKLSKPGTLVAGVQISVTHGREVPTGMKGEHKTVFMHNEETIYKFWNAVEGETGTKWTVKAEEKGLEVLYSEKRDYEWMGPSARAMMFSAIRE